ncbi:hypothetical protein RF11_10641 [Thelohanellus kitauei]|uniref:Uncharacterized protein n=1 Tax=Thelohanellus kitauei TaxID=669202 RepID=A0A0C2N5C0_THEKT|nr:hypothetical protein RF11_10641 [Thelohanellus kitauei]
MDNFEIVKGYNVEYFTCENGQKEDFKSCPIKVFMNIPGTRFVQIYEAISVNSAKKFEYVTSYQWTGEFEIIQRTFRHFSIYFASNIHKNLDGKNVDNYLIDVLTCEFSTGFYTRKCTKCMGIIGIVRYTALLK